MSSTPLLVKAASEIVQRTCSRPVTVRDQSGYMRAVRCGSRFKDVCPGCANLVHGDYQQILRSEVFDADPADRFLFVTLTAPGFGTTHHVPKRLAERRRCRCGDLHDPDRDADLRGLPLDIDTYSYAEQVDFNASVGKLWNATRTALAHHFPDMEYAGVYENQARGAVHLHLLIRLPGWAYGPLTKAQVLTTCTRASAVSPDTGRRWSWGRQIDVRPIVPGEELGRSIWYLLKAVNYLVKEVADEGGGTSPRQAEHWRALRRAARAHVCDGCRRKAAGARHPLAYCQSHDPTNGVELDDLDGTGIVLLPSFDYLDPATGYLLAPVTMEITGDTATCPDCTEVRAEQAREDGPCAGTLHRQNGRRSHTVVMSRGYQGEGGWSLTRLTRGKLRERRAEWAREQHRDLDARASATASFRRAEDQRALRVVLDRYATLGTADPVP